MLTHSIKGGHTVFNIHTRLTGGKALHYTSTKWNKWVVLQNKIKRVILHNKIVKMGRERKLWNGKLFSHYLQKIRKKSWEYCNSGEEYGGLRARHLLRYTILRNFLHIPKKNFNAMVICYIFGGRFHPPEINNVIYYTFTI